jgi:adenylate cyclase
VRALVADLIAVLLLTVYGTQVCPYLDGLGLPYVCLNLAVAFLLSWSIGTWVERTYIDRGAAVRRSFRVYLLTLARYAATGVALAAYDTAFLDFALGSGVKLVVGTLALGHFLGVDLALAKERAVMDELQREGRTLSAIEQPRSFVRRLVGFALGAVVTTAVIAILLLVRDVEYLGEMGHATREAVRAVAIELAFLGAVVVVFTIVLLTSFAKNLRRFLENETRALESVSKGELDHAVPVLSDDEFGVIAAHTNRMIEGLRERRRVQEVLGKIVSPEVARVLLTDQGLALGGQKRALTMLFSDIRDFTTWSEGTEPEALVRDLNLYFTAMVRIVHEHGGVVDKFIGDGLMAIFGLDGREDAPACAVRAGLAMVAALEELNRRVERPIGIGIGVHFGEVVAGNIGSPDRLEFTCIGDTVNTAARIESLTRKVDATILISRPVAESLSDAERGAWVSRGEHPLKGKSALVEVLAPA